MSRRAFRKARAALIAYMMAKVREEDWHAVMDAAADLRVLEASQGAKGSV